MMQTMQVSQLAKSSLLFAVLHITQVFTHGASLSSALLLTCKTCIISIWWGTLVLLGGSIWPAVMFHFVVSLGDQEKLWEPAEPLTATNYEESSSEASG